jgi:hypothetical protein
LSPLQTSLACIWFVEFLAETQYIEHFGDFWPIRFFSLGFVTFSLLLIFELTGIVNLLLFFLLDRLCVIAYQFSPAGMRWIVKRLVQHRSSRKFIEVLVFCCLAQENSQLDEDYRISSNNRICLKSNLYISLKQSLYWEYRLGLHEGYRPFLFWIFIETGLDTWIDREEF